MVELTEKIRDRAIYESVNISYSSKFRPQQALCVDAMSCCADMKTFPAPAALVTPDF